MYILATTRFNTETWQENTDWRKKNNHKGCIYGTPKEISVDITPNIPMFILEMHNDENKVKGIGLIKNALLIKEKEKEKSSAKIPISYRIYNDRNYNRYIYKSNYRIDREDLTEQEKKIIEIFDVLLFKSSRHLKRGQGITSVPSRISNNKHMNFIEFFEQLFKKYYLDFSSRS